MTAKKNGAAGASQSIGAIAGFLSSPAAGGFLASQKLALEATRFWVRRMRAYVDQVEALAGCKDPGEVVSTQARFIERMTEDYAAERQAIAALMTTEPEEPARRGEARS